MTVRTPPTSFHPVQVQDFTVTTDGVGFVSQVATASLCGVTKQAVSKLVKREELSGCRVNLNENSQLDEKTLVLVVGYYASKGNKTAIDTMFKMMQAGARTLVLHKTVMVQSSRLPRGLINL